MCAPKKTGCRKSGLVPYPASRVLVSAAAHAAATIVAQVAIAVPHGDRAATVARRRVGLEVGELLAAGRGGAGVFEHYAGAG